MHKYVRHYCGDILGVCIDAKYEWGKDKMDGEASVYLIQGICDHAKHRTYTLRRFDILKGFEFNETRCFNCYKIVALVIKKFG
jgi:hypothetical protein